MAAAGVAAAGVAAAGVAAAGVAATGCGVGVCVGAVTPAAPRNDGHFSSSRFTSSPSGGGSYVACGSAFRAPIIVCSRRRSCCCRLARRRSRAVSLNESDSALCDSRYWRMRGTASGALRRPKRTASMTSSAGLSSRTIVASFMASPPSAKSLSDR